MSLLDPEDLATFLPAETAAFASPIPTQFVSSDEFTPLPQIPEDMQRKHGFAPLGAADGPVKRAIFGETSARLYGDDRRADLSKDRIALHRDAYERDGPGRTNRRYCFVATSAG
jgi:hypothetical protein